MMKKIKIISSKRFEESLPMMHEVTEEFWEELLKINNGNFIENDKILEFISSSNEKIIVHKDKSHETCNEYISYIGDYTYRDSYERILVMKFTNSNFYELRDYNPYFGESHTKDSFKILIEII